MNGSRLATLDELYPFTPRSTGIGVGIGAGAFQSAPGAWQSVAIGDWTLMAAAGQGANTAVGTYALCNTLTTGNTAIGAFALASNTTGLYNLAVGAGALRNNVTGNGNLAIGQGAMENATGSGNTAIGPFSMGNSTGSDNSGVGNGALQNNSTGQGNAALGNQALFGNGAGNRNTAIGMLAGGGYWDAVNGIANTVGSDNTFVGYNARGTVNNLTRATAIGSGALVGASNSIVLGSGEKVGIGTSTPTDALTVVGAISSTGGLIVDNGAPTFPAAYFGAGGNINVTRRSSEVPTARNWYLTIGGGNANNNPNASLMSCADNWEDQFVYYSMSRAPGGNQTGYNVALDPNGAGGVFVGNAFKVQGQTLLAAASGNVGVGTAAPSAKLEVVGDMKVSGRIRVAPQGDIGMGDFTADPAP